MGFPKSVMVMVNTTNTADISPKRVPGRVIVQKMRQSLAPSIRADS